MSVRRGMLVGGVGVRRAIGRVALPLLAAAWWLPGGVDRAQLDAGDGARPVAAAGVAPVVSQGTQTPVAEAEGEDAPGAKGSDFDAVVRALEGANLAVLEDGRRVRLQGLALPAPAVRPEGFVARLRAFLGPQLLGKVMHFVVDGAAVPGDDADLVATAAPIADAGRTVNAAALAAGLAVLDTESPQVRQLDALRVAVAEAQAKGLGWWARKPPRRFDRWGEDGAPYLNGAVLGLHDRDPGRSYRTDIEALGALGFQHICLLLTAFVEDVEGDRIDRFHPRTATDAQLLEAVAVAKEQGMSVMLLPIVLLLDSGDNEWRGKLRPTDEGRFWREYNRFLGHYLDLAEVSGVEIVSIGSEFGSLEDRTETWRRLIHNARGRFGGSLTYSANWDHVEVPRFFDQLDFIGMTAYFSLTEENDPSREALRAGWVRTLKELEETVRELPRPVVFTELGYASQDGINTDPWNYFIAVDRIDLDEQRDCFWSFRDAVSTAPWLRGAYFYDWFDPGGPGDSSYSPRGKPALEEWQAWASYLESPGSGR